MALQDSRPSHGRILDLLLAFLGKPSLTVDELSELMNEKKSTTYRFVKELKDREFLATGMPSGHYILGPKILELANHVQTSNSLSEIALPLMRELASETEETVILSVVVGDKSLALEQIPGPRPINLSFRPGTLRPLHAGASSKILLANLNSASYSAVLEKVSSAQYSDLIVDDKKALETELKAIREVGYAVTSGEYEPGVKAIAAPIFDNAKKLRAAISVVGPRERFSQEDSQLISLVIRTANNIGARLAKES